ncbi:hypothetical protein [Neptunomonas sp.]|uniref:hypothetical protein n=1 Tax=Neptunomonas sp. TaxID=1971898 RepID=UPI003567B312
MSKAREIAEERFARGEISKEQLQNILDNISSEPQSATTEPPPHKKKGSTFFSPSNMLLAGFAFMILLGFVSKSSAMKEVKNSCLAKSASSQINPTAIEAACECYSRKYIGPITVFAFVPLAGELIIPSDRELTKLAYAAKKPCEVN